MKLRSFFSGLVAVVVVLLLIGVGGFFWIAAQSPLKLLASGDKIPSAAIFVSKQTPAMVSLMVNPDELESLRQVVAAPSQRRRARSELAQFKQSLLANTGLTYKQDVQPWLGDEVTLAIATLDIDRDRSNGRQPGYLLAIATKDPERSREFLQLFWQKRAIRGADLTFEQYKGVKLIYTEEVEGEREKGKRKKEKGESLPTPYSLLPTSSLASAVVGNQFVLFANHPKVLRDAVNNVQAIELNLASADFYTKALDTLAGAKTGFTFINLPRLASWLEQEPTTPDKQRQGEDSRRLGDDRTLAIGLQLTGQGLLAETATPAAEGDAAATLSQPVEALRYIPALSPFAASGTDLDRVWHNFSNNLSSYGAIAGFVNGSLQELQSRWQLDVPEDIFSWVKGEYALGALPQELGTKEREKGKGKREKRADVLMGGEWVFVAERTGEVDQAIAGLDELAAQQGYSVGALQLGDQTVSAWTKLTTNRNSAQSLQADVQGVHGTVGNYEIFATSIAAMKTALESVDNSLNTSDRFRQITAAFSQPNNGYLYIDWDASRPILEQRFPILKVIELAGSPIFNHLRSLTVSSYGNQSGVQRGGVLIKLS